MHEKMWEIFVVRYWYLNWKIGYNDNKIIIKLYDIINIKLKIDIISKLIL